MSDSGRQIGDTFKDLHLCGHAEPFQTCPHPDCVAQRRTALQLARIEGAVRVAGDEAELVARYLEFRGQPQLAAEVREGKYCDDAAEARAAQEGGHDGGPEAVRAGEADLPRVRDAVDGSAVGGDLPGPAPDYWRCTACGAFWRPNAAGTVTLVSAQAPCLACMVACEPMYRSQRLTFARFSAANRTRCESPDGFHHALGSWSTSDWFLAALGELGEAANLAKKLNRVRDGIRGNTEAASALRAKLLRELGDTAVYLDLLAQSLGTSLGAVAVGAFNAKSAEIESPYRITEEP